MPPPERVIGNRIVSLRKERDETQDDLAKALSCSRQTVIAIERGKYKPSLGLVFQFIEHFERPFEEIFYVVAHNTTVTSGNGQHAS